MEVRSRVYIAKMKTNALQQAKERKLEILIESDMRLPMFFEASITPRRIRAARLLFLYS